MKRFTKSMLGVTLLEIMLVLAIAAMIIVMSVRYYQSATVNQQANNAIAQIQAIIAASDSLAAAPGNYTGATINATTVGALLPTGGLLPPWGGGQYQITAAASSIAINMGTIPTAVCNQLQGKLLTPRFNVTCSTITYNSNVN